MRSYVSTNNSTTVLITGASSGFGLASAVALASEGYRVIAAIRNLDKRSVIEEKALSQGVHQPIDIRQLDITDMASIPLFIQHLLTDYDHIDILINNAGFASGGFVEDIPLSMWREQFETNFFGSLAMMQAVLPSMRQKRSGMIINMSSVSAILGFPGMGPYSASKFALEGLSESLRLEMAPYHVRVVLIEPASYKTSIWEKGMGHSAMDANSPYKVRIEALKKDVEHIARTSGDPNEVVQLISKIIKKKNPRFRYPVGKGANALAIGKKLLPWRLLEFMLTRNTPL